MDKINDIQKPKISGSDVEKVIEQITQENIPKNISKKQEIIKQDKTNETIQKNINETTTDAITLTDLHSYFEHGNSDADAKKKLSDFQSTVSNPGAYTRLHELPDYYSYISESLEKCNNLLKDENADLRQLDTLTDELNDYIAELEEIVEDIKWLANDGSDLSDDISYIDDKSEYDEVFSCDDNGNLYNAQGKKIGYIQNYEQSGLKYYECDYEENVAYDENDNPIGQIHWII